MELSEIEIIRKYAQNTVIVIELLYYHMNNNLLASHKDPTESNENTNSLKFSERRKILSMD